MSQEQYITYALGKVWIPEGAYARDQLLAYIEFIDRMNENNSKSMEKSD